MATVIRNDKQIFSPAIFFILEDNKYKIKDKESHRFINLMHKPFNVFLLASYLCSTFVPNYSLLLVN